MSQNQSYFWQTTRHNVYLKRSAKWHMLLALLAVLTFSTICIAEINKGLDDNGEPLGLPTNIDADKEMVNNKADQADVIPIADPTKASNAKGGGFLDGFTSSLSVVLVTELGDKTFFIAAIMAMRHPRLIVFTGAISALALMTVLSVVFGMAATIIPKIYTYYISTALFAIFGLKMIYEGYFMKPSDAQEELEEVQSDLRKREDELLRSKRGNDNDAKRKNSNSDKESDASDVERSAGATSNTATNTALSSLKNPEMQHRQRKQLNNTHQHNNGCEQINNEDNDLGNDSNDIGCTESDAFLHKALGDVNDGEQIKMSTFHSSPALSASALSNQTQQTNCDDISRKLRLDGTPSKERNNATNGDVLVHSASAAGNIAGSASPRKPVTGNSIDSLGGVNSTVGGGGAAGQSNGELKQIGGSKKRLERDVNASNVQDPESGIVRKNSKKGAGYLTTRVVMQAFTMTFLAEWGDRSQLTTIVLATTKDYYGVIAGGIIGHSLCTGLAVIGGRMVAAKISVRTVTIVGGIVFLGFALYALIMRPDDI